MYTKLQNFFLSRAHLAILAAVLCFSVLGVQSVGLFHGVLHANQEQHLQSNTIFDGLEKSFSSNPQKSNLVCKLLDALLLGASVVSQNVDAPLFSFSHVAPIAALQTSFTLLQFWSYQSQAPPPFNPQS